MSYIKLNAERETEIESYFPCNVEFHYPKGLENLNDLLEEFKASSNTAKATNTYSSDDEEQDIVNSGFGEKTKRDQLILMDNVSGLAENSKK